MADMEAPALPWYTATTFRRWASLLVLSFVLSLPMGPLVSFQIIQPQMIDDGAFRSGNATREEASLKLDVVYSIGIGIMFSSMFVLGLYFDSLGPRMLGMVSCVTASAMFLAAGLALQFPSAASDAVLWAAVVIQYSASAGLYLASLAYVQILPEAPFMVSTVVNAQYLLADIFGTAAGYIFADNSLDVRSYHYFYFLTVLAAIACVFCQVLLPNPAEMSMIRQAPRAGDVQPANEAHPAKEASATPPTPPTPPSTKCCCAREAAIIGSACVLCFRTSVFGLVGLVMVAHLYVLYFASVVFQLKQYVYYCTIFGDEASIDLNNDVGIIYSGLGLPLSFGLGFLIDRLGPIFAVVMLDMSAVLFFALVVVPLQSFQLAAYSVYTLNVNGYFLLMPGLISLYSPPELYGTIFGAVNALMGLLQIVLVQAADAIAGLITDDEQASLVSQMAFWTCTIVVLGVANYWLWRRSPPPVAGSVTMASLHEASMEAQPLVSVKR